MLSLCFKLCFRHFLLFYRSKKIYLILVKLKCFIDDFLYSSNPFGEVGRLFVYCRNIYLITSIFIVNYFFKSFFSFFEIC